MFNLFKTKQSFSLGLCLGEQNYSLAAVDENRQLLFSQQREFSETTEDALKQALQQDIEEFNLIGHSCHLILTPGQYQLILMDSLDVPENELAKALRWRLKGLIDYQLNDIAVDAFVVPVHGVGSQKKKAFVAVTPLSTLINKIKILESVFLTVLSVDISELALKNLIVHNETHESILLINLINEAFQEIQLIYQNNIYFTRQFTSTIGSGESREEFILLEIQRSIDYALSELRLPEPQKILLATQASNTADLVKMLEKNSDKELSLIDLNCYVHSKENLSLEEQTPIFYSVCGAVSHLKSNERTGNP